MSENHTSSTTPDNEPTPAMLKRARDLIAIECERSGAEPLAAVYRSGELDKSAPIRALWFELDRAEKLREEQRWRVDALLSEIKALTAPAAKGKRRNDAEQGLQSFQTRALAETFRAGSRGAGWIDRGAVKPSDLDQKAIADHLLEGGTPERLVGDALSEIRAALITTAIACRQEKAGAGFKDKLNKFHDALQRASSATDAALCDGTIEYLTDAYWGAPALLPSLPIEDRVQRDLEIDEDLAGGRPFDGREVAEAMQQRMYRLLDYCQLIGRGLEGVGMRGPIANGPLNRFSEALADIWHRYTGKEPTSGTITKRASFGKESREASGLYGSFAHLVITCLPYDVQSDNDTRDLILKGKDNWRKRRDAAAVTD